MSGSGGKRVTIVVRSASASNRQAAEALRGAVGLGGGGVGVQVLLCEDGVYALGLAGEVEKALATLKLLDQRIFIEAESLEARSLNAPPWVYRIGRRELARLLEESDAVEVWR